MKAYTSHGGIKQSMDAEEILHWDNMQLSHQIRQHSVEGDNGNDKFRTPIINFQEE